MSDHMKKNTLLEPYNPSRAIAALYRTNQAILRSKLQARGIDMSLADYLLALSLKEGATQQELSAELFVSQAAVARTTKNLCEKGIVRREADADDKRLHHIYFTEEGKQLARDVEEVFDELIGMYDTVFDSRERKQFEHLTLKALRHVHEYHTSS